MANALATIGWIFGRLVGVALLPLGLVVWFFFGLIPLFETPPGLHPLLAKPYGAFMMAVGIYCLWAGSRLVRGLLAVTFDPRRFVAGNLCLFAACFAFSVGLAASSFDRIPADAAAMSFAAGALWLWTAVRLLKVDGAPAAGLGRFAAGNVLIAASIVCAFLGAGIHEVGGLPGPGAIVLAAGLALLVLAAWLLRATAPRQRPAEEAQQQDAAAAKQAQHPDTRWRWRHVGGFAAVLLGIAAWWKGGGLLLSVVYRGLKGELADIAIIDVVSPPFWAGLLIGSGAICFALGTQLFRDKQEKLSGRHLALIGAAALIYAYAAAAL